MDFDDDLSFGLMDMELSGAAGGNGKPREWTEEEATLAECCVKLVQVGGTDSCSVVPRLISPGFYWVGKAGYETNSCTCACIANVVIAKYYIFLC